MSQSSEPFSIRVLLKNVGLNLLGTGVPWLVAIYSIPRLIQGMGIERYGLLSIIWMGVGYFSLFDMGIGRALTKLVAERLGDGRESELPELIRTGLVLMWGLGLLAALSVALLAPWMAGALLNIPQWLRLEAVMSFLMLAAALPFVISSAGLAGILQAHQRFDQINLVRIPLGVAHFLGPVLVLIYTQSLVATTSMLAISRVLAWVAYYRFCKPFYRSLPAKSSFDRGLVRMILGFGGWITVTNIISPLMVYFDRFVIGAVIGLSAVAYYTTPYEVVTRLWILPQALMGVLFPTFSSILVSSPERAAGLFRNSGRALLVVMFTPVAWLVLFAPEILALWINKEFASRSTDVMRWLVLGVYINCLARLPYDILQSRGRPDVTAKLHIAELPLYVLVLCAMLGHFGTTGAAAAWTARMIVDLILLFYMTTKIIPELRVASINLTALTALAASILALFMLTETMLIKCLLAIGSLLICVLLGWKELRTVLLRRSAAGNDIMTSARLP